MPVVAKVCSECENRLVYPEGHARAGQKKPAGTKTCSDRCRQKRKDRIDRAKRQAREQSQYTPEQQALAAAVRGDLDDAIHETAKEVVRPFIREAMTEEVLTAIHTMVGLTPEAINVLAAQMQSEDETIAQRAATLMLKYTMGNPSVAPPPAQQAPAPMTVVFAGMPRPGDTTAPVEDSSDTETLRECGTCNQHKSDTEFVGGSDRCMDCFNALRARVSERFDKVDETAP